MQILVIQVWLYVGPDRFLQNVQVAFLCTRACSRNLFWLFYFAYKLWNLPRFPHQNSWSTHAAVLALGDTGGFTVMFIAHQYCEIIANFFQIWSVLDPAGYKELGARSNWKAKNNLFWIRLGIILGCHGNLSVSFLQKQFAWKHL